MKLSENHKTIVAEIEHKLAQELYFDPSLPQAKVLDAMRYATLGGGKRLRGTLTVLSGDFCGVNREKSIALAAAIECMHAYSLVHDDLPAMDNSTTRRGQPSVHRAFGEATAILAGDGLQALAFELAADANLSADGIKAFASAVGRFGMVGGQMHDMLAEVGEIIPSKASLEQLHLGKTGELIIFAACAGVYQSGLEAHKVSLTVYGKRLGLAFQIWDDVLDVIGDEEKTGKPTSQDQNKMTFTSLLGLESSIVEAQRLIKEAKEALPINDFTKPLFEIADFAIDRTS